MSVRGNTHGAFVSENLCRKFKFTSAADNLNLLFCFTIGYLCHLSAASFIFSVESGPPDARKSAAYLVIKPGLLYYVFSLD